MATTHHMSLRYRTSSRSSIRLHRLSQSTTDSSRQNGDENLNLILEDLEICKTCPDGWPCCTNNPHVPITAEEIRRGLKRCDKEGDNSFLPLNEKGECIYFDDKTHLCTCYDIRPKACRDGFCKNMPAYQDGSLQKMLIEQQQAREERQCQ